MNSKNNQPNDDPENHIFVFRKYTSNALNLQGQPVR